MNLKEKKKLLVKHGFIEDFSKLVNTTYFYNKEKGFFETKEGEFNPDHANIELGEEGDQIFRETGYPVPYKRERFVLESPNANIEENYYWLLSYLKHDESFPYADKIIDVFSASEQSASWGAAQSRLGMQQDRAGQNLKGISEMIKQLFQLVRELRILDEKLEPREKWKEHKAADVALKGEYTDLVENKGGQVSPGSIFHLAQNVGYAALPDLFFNTHVYSLEEVDKKVDSMQFNKNIKQVLKRKLYAYVNWKLKTDAELKNRKQFTLRYLRQHWTSIQMTMNWVKPYLRNIARLQMSEEHIESADLISSFETSMTEIEILIHRGEKGHAENILLTFKFRTVPELSFQKDSYQHKGPIHSGRVQIDFRSYGWNELQRESYKKMRKEEDMKLLGLVDGSVQAAMEALGEDLENYLAEAEEKTFIDKKNAREKEEDEKRKRAKARSQMGMLDPFISIFQGIWEIGSSFAPSKGSSKKSSSKESEGFSINEKKEFSAAKKAFKVEYRAYKNFKKAHQLMSE